MSKWLKLIPTTKKPRTEIMIVKVQANKKMAELTLLIAGALYWPHKVETKTI